MTTKNLNFTDGVPLHETTDGNIRVIGSRVTMFTIIGRFEVGDTVEEIHEGFPSVSIPQINAIIEWYLKNRTEVDEYIREVEAEAEELRREIESWPQNIAFREKVRRLREQSIKN